MSEITEKNENTSDSTNHVEVNMFRASDSQKPRWEEQGTVSVDSKMSALCKVSDSQKPAWDVQDCKPEPIRIAFGSEIADKLDGVIEGPSPEIKNLWNKYKEKIRINNPEYKGTQAWYSISDGGVTHDITASAKGNSFEPPYQVSFHEFGHNIDFQINEEYGNGNKEKAMSETYKDGLLGKTAKAEAETFINEYHQKCKQGKFLWNIDDTCGRIKNDLSRDIPLMFRCDISDIFEGATGGKVSLGIGHGKEYWKGRDNGKEVFAEMFSASVCNSGSLNMIKQYFPETYKVFQEIVRLA
jgi:hypothetical protein